MNYLYIICLALSSLFTYKPLFAETPPLQYAFFIPGGAFQQNTKIQDIRQMKPRYAKSNSESDSSTAVSSSLHHSIADSSIYSDTPETYTKTPATTSSTQLSASSTSEMQNTLPVVKKQIVSVKKISAKPEIENNASAKSPAKNNTTDNHSHSSPTNTEIASKLQKYKLDENILPTPEDEPVVVTTQDTSLLENLRKKSLNEMLQAIPYPNTKLPKFKQRYATYGLEMRVMQRRGKFPANPDQEKTLAKANSLMRFEVK